MLASGSLWSLGVTLEYCTVEFAAKLLWAKLEYLGIVGIPVAWFVFASQYTGRGEWVRRRNLALIMVVPLVTLALVFTNELHGLIWSRTGLGSIGPYTDLELRHGLWFWVWIVLAYAALLAGIVMLVSTLARSFRLYRLQGIVVICGILAPWAANAVYVLGFSPLPGLDLTPFGLIFAGIAFVWGMNRHQLLEVSPVARTAVIECMRDAVIVTDLEGRIVDLNGAAQAVLGRPDSETVGRKAGWVLPVGIISPEGADQGEASEEVHVGEGPGRLHYEVSRFPLSDRGGRVLGSILTLRDVTEERRAQEELRRSEERYRSVVEQAAEGIFLCTTADKRILESNSAFGRLLGYSAAELRGMSLYEIIDHDPEDIDANVRRVIEGRETSLLGERRYRRRDGALVDLEVSASLLSYGGQAVICAVVRDITERRPWSCAWLTGPSTTPSPSCQTGRALWGSWRRR